MPVTSRNLRDIFTFGLGVAAASALLSMRPPRRGSEAPLPGTITVVGTGTASLPPDQARVDINVRATAPSAQEATRQGAEAMNAIIALLKGRGIADRDIQTGYFSISPEYEHRPEGAPRRVGHSATNSVTVIITDLSAIGGILDAVVDTGGDLITVNQLHLIASNPKDAQDSALRDALNDARRQARLIAQEMGLTLGAPLAIQPQGASLRPPGPRMMAMARQPTYSPIEAGEMEVTATLEVVFSIQ
jgi:uncharacterized protein YggE